MDPFKLGRCIRATRSKRAPESRHKPVELGSRVHVLGEQVGRVYGPINFPELELCSAQALLYPEAVALQVPHLP